MSKTNEEVLKEILEQSLAGYWDWDIPTGNEYLSPSFKTMFGYEDHEIENLRNSTNTKKARGNSLFTTRFGTITRTVLPCG
jgi:PAS domain-containing protein